MKYLLIAVPISILIGAWLGFSYAKYSDLIILQKQEAYYKEQVDILQKEVGNVEDACLTQIRDTANNCTKPKG